ncbi:histidine phosphatase family protein [Aliiglaciecola sp. CAU 1673]|uniref:SixA phosphatase family protein n=1 Tax=Aliiglaciecola sp. CAU 1673 TaxID=3032595 RepID=UPI0023DCA4D2|nr:histidine phosphatase family protein [Aliiglaciecola sp. CAU 1673]MDF2179852.1 histidine phosphatase family protein [Aliiglaciecola sp. CAU 1673]
MKTLTLFRHAKSSWKYDIDDAFRPLNARGYRDAPLMAAEFSGQQPELVLCSPAIRTYSTALIYLEYLQIPLQRLQLDWALYETSGERLMSFLKTQSDNVQHIWLFGHNPGLNELLDLCLQESQENLVTGAWASLAFDCSSWTVLNRASLLASAKPQKEKTN